MTAVISGAAGTDVALITAGGRVRRATVEPDRARVQWELDAASARFARLEIREARGRPLGAMVALTNPIWLAWAGQHWLRGDIACGVKTD
jgi:hypothetical protein